METIEDFGYDRTMDRDEILTTLRREKFALRAVGVKGLSLFGSVARGEESDESDIDLAVTLDTDSLSSGFAYFGRLAHLSERLSQLLGREVDIVAEPAQRRDLQNEIDRDRCIAF